MAFQGFGKNSGPSSNPPRAQTLFGNFPTSSPSPPQTSPSTQTLFGNFPTSSSSSPSPPQISSTQNFPQQRSPQTLFGNFSTSPSPPQVRSIQNFPQQRSPRPTPSPPRLGNHPKLLSNDLNFQSYQTSSPVAPYSASRNAAAGIPSRPANSQGPKRTRSPPSANTGFMEDSTVDRRGPREDFLHEDGGQVIPQRMWSPPLAYESNHSYEDLDRPPVEDQRPTLSPPRLGNHPKLLSNDLNFQSYQTSSPVAPYSASRNAAARIPSRPANSQGPKRTRSPPSANAGFMEDPAVDRRRGPRGDFLHEDGGQVIPQRMWSPPLAYESNHSYEDLDRPLVEDQRSHTKVANFQVLKGTKSPPLSSANEVPWRASHPPRNDSDRPVESPPRMGNKSTMLAYNSNPQTQQRSSNFAASIVEHAGTKRDNNQFPKRTRSPSSPSADEVSPGNPHVNQDDTEREMQAKAKRLARFKVELTQPEQSSHDASKHKVSGNRHDPALAEKRKLVAEHPREGAGDLMVSDYEGLDSSSVIIGLCPDMCPESEREERERKGDLDKYERLDGDRNQTSKSIAVKKYNRTAEREVDLIRPMPVLQKTVAYLLDLLDQPYDDRFLKLYNFLWDRMRAVRMDLRMQHIFNQDAISMLEQMIRLHIIAMHELCEYTKGEGFSEGFDAHLNIEQMNKTSVELFQMYDDHRKRGIIVPSEKEFRGYYALLKLDKHPGYKVEPAELSLDLAKMTPEIRQTPEILFARDVARACRTGNFIAFFRLARKTTYLQACLMHAHFAKLRTQALASLHSGLQNNQGIPIPQVTKWLGMEGEDIESLLEYHGFTIKEFEEPYMVKDGLFLNDEKDYPTKCSELVLLKKSSTIIEDVSSGQVVWPAKEVKQVVSDRIGKLDPKAVRLVTPKTLIDEDMLEFKDEPAPVVHSQVHPVLQIPVANDQSGSESSDHQGSEVSEVSLMSWNAPSSPCSPQPLSAMARRMRNQETLPDDSLEMKLRSPVKEKTLQTMIRDPAIDSYQGSYADSLAKNSAPQKTVINPQENVEAMIVHQEVESEESLLISQEVEDEAAKMAQWEYEAASANLKLILRIWKRRSSKQKMLREKRLMAAKAALNSLTLGPPIQQNKTQQSHVTELNIDHVLRERHERYGRSWSRLNVSEVIARILSERNPDANCLSWKLIICSQTKGIGQTNILAGHWLLSKLMGTSKENDDDLAVSSPGLSIWKKWVTSRLGCPPVCCLSVIRDTEVHKSDYTVAGASAVLFLVSDSIPWEVQKTAFYNLLMSLPSGSRLPLLILSDMCDEEVQTLSLTIINELGLHYLDKTRISSFSIVYLLGNRPSEHLDGFFSNDRLMEGLQWLASESSLQPALRCVKSRELVMGHFNCSLEMLDKINVSLLGPNHCITAFNAALDRATEEVTTAASTNLASWPCPEIDLLESSSDERRAVESFLPIVGWSSAASVKPIISTMQDSKLPFFAEDLSWLSHGSDMRKETENQKAELEKCLIRYLTHSSQMMEWGLATMEASVLLQKSTQLELHGVNFRIIPRWVAVFRRISNWRLMNLTSGISSVAYVSRNQRESSCAEPCDMASPTSEGLDNTRLDGDRYPTALTQPSLDEMIEVGYCPLPFGRNEPESEIIQPLPETIDEGNESSQATNTSGFVEDDRNLPQDGEFRRAFDASLSDSYVSSIFVVGSEVKKEADRLSKLLQQCNMLQDSIDEKLSIYF